MKRPVGGSEAEEEGLSQAESTSGTTQAPRGHAGKIFWRIFRGARVTGLSLVLCVVVTGFFLNKIGLPEFVKRRVVEQLRQKGWEVQFSRLRLRWYRGIVAEHLQLQRTNQLYGPHLFVEEAQCRLQHKAFEHLDLHADSLTLKGGRLLWPLSATNQPGQAIIVNDLSGELRFQDNDVWELRHLRADVLGVKFLLTGTLTNASLVRDWKFPRRAAAPPGTTEALWHRIMSTAEQLHFGGTQELFVDVRGDAGNFKDLEAELHLTLEQLESPWLAGTNIFLSIHLSPPVNSNSLIQATVALTAEDARLRWGQAQTFELNLEFEPALTSRLPTGANLRLELAGAETRWGKAARLLITAATRESGTNAAEFRTELVVRAEEVRSEWGRSARAEVTATSSHPATNFLPALVTGAAAADAIRAPWGELGSLRITGQGTLPPTNQLKLLETRLAWPDRFENIGFSSLTTFTNFHSTNFAAQSGSARTEWRAPRLRLETSIYPRDGELAATAELDAVTRELSFRGASSVEAQTFSPLLTTNSQRWLANYRLEKGLRLEAQGRLRLPPWTNRQPDWARDVLPSFFVTGRFEAGKGAYRGVTFESARSPFSFSNQVWRTPELHVSRPEGALDADYSSDLRTRDFHWRLLSRLDLKALQPLFPQEHERRVFDYFGFTTPPEVRAEIWGRWGDRELQHLGVVAEVAVSNCTFRGETLRECHARGHYTNKVFVVLEPQLRRDGEEGSAPGIRIDLNELKLYLTNAFGNLNPYAFTRAIGPHAAAALEPYQFDSSPTVRVNGVVDLKSKRYEENLHFEVSGGAFQWRNFHLQQLAGNLDWVGQTLALTNVHGAFRSGRLDGDARFDFAPASGTEFSFRTTVAEADLHALMADLSQKTNHLEGRLSGELVVNKASLPNRKSWQGYGRVSLRDGLIWDIPIFGFFSPILNAFLPGLGNSRAKEGTATFTITNSVVHSSDLETRATMMRMQMQGTVDFDRRIEVRAEAELLRDLPAIGFVISKILWPVTKLFEYRMTGTLDQPKAEPLYVLPKILLLPFHPFRTLKELMTEEEKNPAEKPP